MIIPYLYPSLVRKLPVRKKVKPPKRKRRKSDYDPSSGVGYNANRKFTGATHKEAMVNKIAEIENLKFSKVEWLNRHLVVCQIENTNPPKQRIYTVLRERMRDDLIFEHCSSSLKERTEEELRHMIFLLYGPTRLNKFPTGTPQPKLLRGVGILKWRAYVIKNGLHRQIFSIDNREMIIEKNEEGLIPAKVFVYLSGENDN